MNYYVVADPLTVLGFSLAGVRGKAASNAQETREAFKEALSDTDTGVLIITERLADLIRPEVDELLLNEQFPLVVEIPDSEGPLEGKPSLRDMVHKAIGVSV